MFNPLGKEEVKKAKKCYIKIEKDREERAEYEEIEEERESQDSHSEIAVSSETEYNTLSGSEA